jgi:hypothetical protein
LGAQLAEGGVLITEEIEEGEIPERAKLYELEDSVVSAGDVEVELSSVGDVVDLRGIAEG